MAADETSLPGGLSAAHDTGHVDVPASVAPTTGKASNTLRPPLLPIACWRLDDVRFAFDSSFLAPAARKEVRMLVALIEKNPKAPASVFGHADPTGTDKYNKQLSGRRAQTIHGLLGRDAAIWESLWSDPLGGDDWGVRSLQTILANVSAPDGAPYYVGPIDGIKHANYLAAVRRFQEDHGLVVDGDAGRETRKQLFFAYMDYLTGVPDPGFVLKPEDFLGAGADPKGKAAFQGCSEFNPVLVFSKEEQKRLDRPEHHHERNDRNATNRRVVVYLFAPGTKVNASKWPCPTVDEGGEGCKARFWPDGDARRSPKDVERTYAETHDTMACRFYEQFSQKSPCEGVSLLRSVRLTLHDRIGNVLVGAPFRITADDGTVASGSSDAKGVARWLGAQKPKLLKVEWSRPKAEKVALGAPDPASGMFEYTHTVRADFREGELETKVHKRLANLGYFSESTLEENIRQYQRDRDLEPTGDVAEVEPTVRAEHDKPDVPLTSREPAEMESEGGPPPGPEDPPPPPPPDDAADDAPSLYSDHPRAEGFE